MRRASARDAARRRRRCAMPALWLSLLLIACGDPKHGRRASPVIEPTWVVCGNAVATLSGYDDVAVLLVMDRSRSMSWDGKWGTTRGAVERALKTNSGLLRVGLLMFPRAADVCAVEATLDVPFAQDNGAAIGAAMRDAPTLQGTPTGAALRAAGDVLREVVADVRVVVLATDGYPSCPDDCTNCENRNEGFCVDGVCDVCDDNDLCARREMLDAVAELAREGIATYVIGIEGSDEARDILEEAALRGGTALPRSLSPTAYYDTRDATDVAFALTEIAVGVDGCSVALPAFEGCDACTTRLEVSLRLPTVDGAAGGSIPLANDGLDGWERIGGRIRLNGDACVNALTTKGDVAITWLCPETPIIDGE